MPPDSLLRRVRWGNVARLLALPAVVLLVVLWPRLSPAPPRLPAAGPRPVAAASPAARSGAPSRARGAQRGAAEDDAAPGRRTAAKRRRAPRSGANRQTSDAGPTKRAKHPP